jgi:hypothetical protein
MFSVLTVLEKIAADRECKRSHNAELKKEVASTISYLKEENAEEETNEQKAHRIAAAAIAPLELATKSKSPSIQVIAIDTLCKLLAHAHFTGNEPDPEPENPQRKAIDRLLTSIADAFQAAVLTFSRQNYFNN